MPNSKPYRMIQSLAQQYFDYIAKNYPVMCLSDEFYFFARSKAALGYLSRLDSLDKEKITQNISDLKRLRYWLEKIDKEKLTLKDRIDLTLLSQSISTFLREFGELKIWQTNPNIYLKIILLGIEHLLIKAPYFKKDIWPDLLSKLGQIPRILKEAKENLKTVSGGYKETSLEIIDFGTEYLKGLASLRLKASLENQYKRLLAQSISSLGDFKTFLKSKSGPHFYIKDASLLERILKDSFGCDRSLKEIFSIASRELARTKEKMHTLAKSIEPGKSSSCLLARYRIKAGTPDQLLELYSQQIERIKRFLTKENIVTIPKTPSIIVAQTPYYMLPVRASASYACVISDNKKEPAFFYITSRPHSSIKKLWLSNIHHEYIFVAAHETYPGHHLLDSIRRNLTNPIRAQTESVFFYEGWASYAEKLLASSSYIPNNSMQQLVGLKRQGWRAIRAMLDVGIRLKKITLPQAATGLSRLGYKPASVRLMLRHYLLTPGYQLCYTIGKFEFERLKKKFAPNLGLKRFHDAVLGGGQMPFSLLEERLEQLRCRKPKNS